MTQNHRGDSADDNHGDHAFDRRYWEEHWAQGASAEASTYHRVPAVNPHLVAEVQSLTPGTALDAGTGAGTEAVWLASHGWQVTGADISQTALVAARHHAADAEVADRVTWVEADLTTWDPDRHWDLVITNYAHPSIPQIAFYQRIAQWVAPGGTLLIVAHQPSPSDHQHPHGATASLTEITAALDPVRWSIQTAHESTRTVGPSNHSAQLHDAVVRATRLS